MYLLRSRTLIYAFLLRQADGAGQPWAWECETRFNVIHSVRSDKLGGASVLSCIHKLYRWSPCTFNTVSPDSVPVAWFLHPEPRRVHIWGLLMIQKLYRWAIKVIMKLCKISINFSPCSFQLITSWKLAARKNVFLKNSPLYFAMLKLIFWKSRRTIKPPLPFFSFFFFFLFYICTFVYQ